LPTACGIDFAHVHFGQSIPEGLKEERGLGHAGVDLTGMSDVETESGGRQLIVEQAGEFLHRSPNRLPLVHVLDQQTVAEGGPVLGMVDHIGMHDNGITRGDRGISHIPDDRGFLLLVEFTRSVNGDECEVRQIQVRYRFAQRREFCQAESREFDRSLALRLKILQCVIARYS